MGDKKVIEVKLQTLRRDFETLSMKNNESVQDYMSRVSSIVNLMKSYGEIVSDKIIVAKALKSLTNKSEHVVAAIEESKDLSNYSFDELMTEVEEEVDIMVEVEAAAEAKVNLMRQVSKRVTCNADIARSTVILKLIAGLSKKNEQKHANFSEKVEEESKLFMAHSPITNSSDGVWFIDSGCSNHMSGTRSLLRDLDVSQKSEVRLGEGK
ncbi:uncharacterized protein LOC107802483 [Nicotiana tabacum]|uniref:Uncharacterized protein LOC107802483 n=2 Tax=Nicotiana TaxID=4085 RepID=A0A1S4AXS8_TOBAC|nr:PREDICTED: uncharacterized protein LOC104236632 [Nicotiana sylvestris]XP_016481482.1 PREDICTED: uncharacterized protein LOC107802483 [Nicotiana tabacum]